MVGKNGPRKRSEISSKMYENTKTETPPQGGPQAGPQVNQEGPKNQSDNKDKDIEDADFEVVDEDK